MRTNQYVLDSEFFLDDFSCEVSLSERGNFSRTRTMCGMAHQIFNLYKIEPNSYKFLSATNKKDFTSAMELENKMAVDCFKNNEFFTALHHAKIAYALSIKTCDPNIEAEALTLALTAYNLGANLQQAGKPAKAIPFFKESLALRINNRASSDIITKTQARLDKAQFHISLFGQCVKFFAHPDIKPDVLTVLTSGKREKISQIVQEIRSAGLSS